MLERKIKKPRKEIISKILFVLIFMLLSYLIITYTMFCISLVQNYKINVSNKVLENMDITYKRLELNIEKIKNIKLNNLDDEDINCLYENFIKIKEIEKNKLDIIKSNKGYNVLYIYKKINNSIVLKEMKIINLLEKTNNNLKFYELTKDFLKEGYFLECNSNKLFVNKMIHNDLDGYYAYGLKVMNELKSLLDLTNLILEDGEYNG